MSECLKCGKNAEYTFHTLEVHTLPVRDFNGEKKVQALGGIKDFSVCYACTQEKLNSILNPVSNLLVRCIPGILILILGAVLTVLLWETKDMIPVRMFGAAALFCGATVLYSIIQKTIQQRNEFLLYSQDELLENAAWLCVLGKAPKKFNENDLSYIPIINKTLGLKNGDLMVLYNLLPQIAVQAFEKIHSFVES